MNPQESPRIGVLFPFKIIVSGANLKLHCTLDAWGGDHPRRDN
jgi:hypothetical protein